MLDFSRLKTPANHGDVLIAPRPAAWADAVQANHASLDGAETRLLDSTLAAWRRRTREAIAGSNEAPVIVLGHQPAFIHPGVWAKHVAAMRVATAVGGVAVNLVVDNDSPRQTAISVPSADADGVELRAVSFARLRRGCAYEQIRLQDESEVSEFERQVREAMRDRFEVSQMPVFFESFRRAIEAADWVDQAVFARRAVEADLGVVVEDRRVSHVWCSPLLIDMLVRAEQFAGSYNKALAAYRRDNGVRSAQRPIPDLESEGGRCEVAAWAYRPDEPRRRMFVIHAGRSLRLFADREEIGEVPMKHLGSCEDVGSFLGDLGEWRIRPRALTLTIWARLLLADLFIHGIGGAKYDRISDAIMADYYAVKPPHMACVSATLHLDLPTHAVTPGSVRSLRRIIRDLKYNPQRHPPHRADAGELIERRDAAVREMLTLRASDRRNRRARNEAFGRIREINAAILAGKGEQFAVAQAGLEEACRHIGENHIAMGREYFFGLYDRKRLQQLMGAVPRERAFRV